MSQDNERMQSKSVPLYSSYTYYSPSFLVRYPHRKRNRLVSEVILSKTPKSWLDYGAGDGSLVGMPHARNALPRDIALYEPEDTMRQQLCEKVGSLSNRVKIAVAQSDVLDAKYDLITALEVLEHLPLPERISFYSLLAETLECDGKCLIEVPVEYGPVLLLKEPGRKFIKRRESEYSFRELMGTFVGNVHDSYSRYDLSDTRTFISPHRGFDLMLLLRELSAIGEYKEIVRSPFPIFPKMFNQAILFEFNLVVRDTVEIEDRISSLYNSMRN